MEEESGSDGWWEEEKGSDGSLFYSARLGLQGGRSCTWASVPMMGRVATDAAQCTDVEVLRHSFSTRVSGGGI